MQKNFLTFLTLILLTNLLSFTATPALAQRGGGISDEIRTQLDDIRNVYDPEEDVTPTTLAETVAKIIKIVLNLLGIIFIILILYAGFTWMTSAGNEEKVSKAKKIMAAAIIGVAIVLAAYMITIFVIENLMTATGIEED